MKIGADVTTFRGSVSPVRNMAEGEFELSKQGKRNKRKKYQ
jgi:hypothetical protein